MSSQTGEAFLPPLDQCLARSASALSWRLVQDQLVLSTKGPGLYRLKPFLTDERNLTTLINALRPFEQPSQTIRQEFETRTAPINVSATRDGRKDIDQLKEDALWLSTQLEIDEVTCLRLALIEWQQRPADLVLGKFAPQDISKRTEGGGNSNAVTSLTDLARHGRLLQVFLDERSALRATCAILVSLDASDKTIASSVGQEPWLEGVAERLRSSRSSKRTDFIAACIVELSQAVDALEDSKSWPSCFQVDFALHEAYLCAILQDMVSIMRHLLTHIFHADSVTTSDNILGWFRLMRRASYFQTLNATSSTQTFFCEILQGLVAVLSAAIFKLAESIAELDRIGEDTISKAKQLEKSYLQDDTCIRELNLLIFEAATTTTTVAAPAIYAWSIISMYIRDIARAEQEEIRQIEDAHDAAGTHHRHGSVSRRPSAMELKLDALQDMQLGEARDDPPQHLARQAADDLDVYGVVAELSRLVTSVYSTPLEAPLAETCRGILYDLVGESLPFVTYDERVVEATLAILLPASHSLTSSSSQPLVSRILRDRSRFLPLVFDQALSRYPYELNPLLQLLNALSSETIRGHDEIPTARETFANLKSITLTLPDNFRGYVLEHEEEGANAFRLIEDLPLFNSRTLQSFSAHADTDGLLAITNTTSQALCIPRGTHGVILRDSRPFIVRLQHKHNGLHYLSLLLETYLKRAVYDVAPPAASVDDSTCFEIIGLINTLLKHAVDKEDAATILIQLAEALPDGSDIISVIANILETELSSFAEQTGSQRSTDLVVICLNFFIALHRYSPDRVWSVLSQSCLLGDGFGAGPMSAIFSSASNDYLSFANTFGRLYQCMLDNALEGLVHRQSDSSGPARSRRFDSPVADSAETSSRTITRVLTTFTHLVLDVLQHITADKLLSPVAASVATTSIMQSLHQLLVSVYGLESGEPHRTAFATVLKPAADVLLSTFLADNLSEQSLVPLLAALNVTAQNLQSSFISAQREELLSQASASLKLLTLLVRVSKQFEQSQLTLAALLTKAVGTIASLFASSCSLRKTGAELLIVIIAGLNTGVAEPASIFSHLPSTQGQYFLYLLTELDEPFQEAETVCTIWTLFSAACEHGQHWFAMYLLTGILPRDRLKSSERSSTQTVLSKALDSLVDIKNLAPERALAMTIFVAKAQKLWIWATSLVRSHTDFLRNILTWLAELKPASRSMSPADALLAAREYTMAAALCDMLAVSLHASLETGDKNMVKLVAPQLKFLTEHAVRTDVYNKGLHNRLRENLASRFSGLSPGDFKRTHANPAPLGRLYLYDVDIAAHALSHDESWAGNGKRGSSGFEEEFIRANINWSLVDASIQLLAEWKILAITLAGHSDPAPDVVDVLVKTIDSCLDASVNADLDLPDVASILQTRADLTFGLLSRLSDATVDTEKAREILTKAWSLVVSSPVDFDVAKATDDLTYYRTLLQILLLSLNLHNAATRKTPQAASQHAVAKIDFQVGGLLVEVVTRTVTTGFQALCGNLHESTASALPDDFGILTALLQAVLASESATHVSSQIADAVAFSAVARSASSLFSWSDRIAELNEHDPVYGEMSAMFLATLSRVPKVAEQLALDGLLTQLSSANLSDYLRKPSGKGPFDEPGRMFVIWTDAFLPLCINMLGAVGPPVASEISSFLNSFPQQLGRAAKSLVNASPGPHDPRAGSVTLGLLKEARDLILIAQVLKASILLGAAEGIASSDVEELKYDVASVVDDVEALTKSQRSLRDRITPSNAHEMALYAKKNVGGRDNALEAAVVKEIVQIKGMTVE